MAEETSKQLTVDIGYWKSPMYQDSYYAPYNPDDLARKFGGNRGIDTYKKMKNDDAVKAALFVKKSAVVSTGWSIKPATEDKLDQQIADETYANLTDTFEGNFETSIMNILSALEYGFSVLEKIFIIDGNKILLNKLKAKPPQSFEFWTDNFGNLQDDGFKQWTAKGALINLPRDKFIYYVYSKDIDNWYGDSDLRASYRSWFSKDMIIKAWNIYLERCGIPLVVGKYDKNTSPEERTELQSMLDNISFKTSLMIPEDSAIEFQQDGKGATGDFNTAIDKHNQMIMRSILVPRHIGFDEAEGGSYALGKVNFGVFAWVVNRIRQEIEDLINEQLIRQMVLLNYPNIKAFPKFVFNPLTEEDKNEKAAKIIEALRVGAVGMDVQTENYLRGLLGLPEAEVKKEKSSKLDAKEYKLKRQLTKYEKKVDFQFIKESLVDKADEALDAVKAMLRKIRDDFTNQIVRKKVIEDKNVSAANQLEFKYIRDLGLTIEGFLDEGYTNGKKSAKDTVKNYNYATPVSGIGLVKSKAKMWIKSQAKLLTGTVSDTLQNKAKMIVLDGIQKGLPINEVVNHVDEAFERYLAIEGIQGSIADSRYLYSEINTNIAKAFRNGLDDYNADLEVDGFIEAYEYSAILDDSTTPECEALDGLVFGVNNPVWDNINPPIWWNCRSTRVQIFQGEEWTEDNVPSIVYTSDHVFSLEGNPEVKPKEIKPDESKVAPKVTIYSSVDETDYFGRKYDWNGEQLAYYGRNKEKDAIETNGNWVISKFVYNKDMLIEEKVKVGQWDKRGEIF